MKIYYAGIETFSEEEMEIVMQLLPKERLERIERTKLKKSQLESMSAGLLLEYALRERGLRSKELTFLKNADGKPYILGYPEFHYNLSHTKEYVALITDKHPVGIDVEGLRVGYQKLVERFFSEEERQLLAYAWSDEVFTKLWTRKESYLKASGFGMRMPLDGFSVLGEQVSINEKMDSSMIESGEVYYLASQPLSEGYWLSVCRKAEPVLSDGSMLVLEQVDLLEFLKRV